MSAVESPFDAPAGTEDVDIEGRLLAAAEAVKEAREFMEYKVSGDGRITDPDRFDQRRKGCHEIGYLADRERDLLKQLWEYRRSESLAELEKRLGLSEGG